MKRLLKRLFRKSDYYIPARQYCEEYEHRSNLNAFAFFLSVLLFVVLFAVFGNPATRIWASIKYFGYSVAHIFGYLFLDGKVDIPTAPNDGTPEFAKILINLKSFAYCYQNSIGALFNGKIAEEWGYRFLNDLVNGTKWVLWLPVIIMLIVLVFTSATKYKNEPTGKTKALDGFDDKVVLGFFGKVVNAVFDFDNFLNGRLFILSRGDYERRRESMKDGNGKHWKAYFLVDPQTGEERELSLDEYKIADSLVDGIEPANTTPAQKSLILSAKPRFYEWREANNDLLVDKNGNPFGTKYAYDYAGAGGKKWLSIWLCMFLVFSHLGLAAFDLIVWYYDFIYTWQLLLFLQTFASVSIDFIVFFRDIGIFGCVSLGVLLFVKYCVSEGLDKLTACQQANEEFEDRTKTIAEEITGAPNTGKTSFMSEMTIDFEAKIRGDALQVMRESETYFPMLNWQEARVWYIRRTARNLKSARIVNRAQLTRAVNYLYDRWQSDPSKSFFGLKQGMKITAWDGASEYTVLEAVKDYLSAYQLYGVLDPLAYTNYSVEFFDTRKGHYFPLFEGRGDYLKHNRKYRSLYSVVASYDTRRWKQPFDPANAKRALGNEAGGVTAFTELALEMPNRYEANEANGKKGKKDEDYDDDKRTYVSPVADGTLLALRTARHPYMIHNHCFTYIFFDTQKPGSVPDSVESTIENHSHIVQAFDPDNALPFWDTIGGFAFWVSSVWYKFDDKYKANRNQYTMLYRLVDLATLPFRRWYEVMNNKYGYHKIVVRREVGGTANTTGETTQEAVYIINRHTYGSYSTDCYRPILDNLTLGLSTGLADSTRYGHLQATSQELALQGSRTLDEIMKAVNKDGDDGRSKRKMDAIIDSL